MGLDLATLASCLGGQAITAPSIVYVQGKTKVKKVSKLL